MDAAETPDIAVALDQALRAMAGPTVAVGSRRISSGDVAGLFAAEADAVALAVPTRVREFATGRALLRQLIGVRCAIPVAPSRKPLLPTGVRGSLAHDRLFAVAAVTRDPQILSVGIDIEPTDELPAEMAASILRDDENGIDAHLAFTLKEATYKAWSSLGGRMLEHHEVRLSVSDDTFSADVIACGTAPRGSFGGSFGGSFARVADRWIALVTVVADHPTPGTQKQPESVDPFPES